MNLTTRREILQLAAAAALLQKARRTNGASPLAVAAAVFVGGLVLSDVIHGVLKAYGIDLEGAVENFVRSVIKGENKGYKRQITAPGRAREPQISELGISGSGNALQVGTTGVRVAKRVQEKTMTGDRLIGHWIPGMVFWVATNAYEARPATVDLADCRCGHPKGAADIQTVHSDRHKVLTQHFERGRVTLVLDAETRISRVTEVEVEQIIERNWTLHREEIWVAG